MWEKEEITTKHRLAVVAVKGAVGFCAELQNCQQDHRLRQIILRRQLEAPAPFVEHIRRPWRASAVMLANKSTALHLDKKT